MDLSSSVYMCILCLHFTYMCVRVCLCVCVHVHLYGICLYVSMFALYSDFKPAISNLGSFIYELLNSGLTLKYSIIQLG